MIEQLKRPVRRVLQLWKRPEKLRMVQRGQSAVCTECITKILMVYEGGETGDSDRIKGSGRPQNRSPIYQ